LQGSTRKTNLRIGFYRQQGIVPPDLDLDPDPDPDLDLELSLWGLTYSQVLLGGNDRATKRCIGYKHKLDSLENALRFVWLCESKRKFSFWRTEGAIQARRLEIMNNAIQSMRNAALSKAFRTMRDQSMIGGVVDVALKSNPHPNPNPN